MEQLVAGPFNVLVLGASYGSLLGIKLGLAGHRTHLICLPAEAELINREGAVVRMPVKGREGLIEVNSKSLPGELSVAALGEVDESAPSQFLRPKLDNRAQALQR